MKISDIQVIRIKDSTSLITKFLNGAKVDEVYSSRDLAERLGISRDTVQRSKKKIGDKYCYTNSPCGWLWGHPKAIMALKKRFIDHNESTI